MNKKLALLLVVLTSASLQLPTLADDEWFHKWDSNHDGKWNYRDFTAANRHWYRKHPGVLRLSEDDMHRRWYELDQAHHGYVTPDDVRKFHEEWK